MVDWLITAFFATFLVCMSLLMRRFYHAYREDWTALGEPIGPLWAPREYAEELLFGIASRRGRTGMKEIMKWMFFTPEWIRREDSGRSLHLLISSRVLYAGVMILLLIEILF